MKKFVTLAVSVVLVLLVACGRPAPGSASSLQDVPLAQLIHQRAQAKEQSTLGTEILQMGSLDAREELIPITQKHLKALQKAKVLPEAMVEQIYPYLEGSLVMYIHSQDKLNCEMLSCDLGLGIVPPYYVNTFFDNTGGKVYGFSVSLPFAYPMDEAGRDAALQNYLSYLYLDAFGDWEKQPYSPPEDEIEDDYGDMAPFGSSYVSATAGLAANFVWRSTDGEYLYASFTLQVVGSGVQQ